DPCPVQLLGRRIRTREAQHAVPRTPQLLDHRASDETGRAGNENTHSLLHAQGSRMTFATPLHYARHALGSLGYRIDADRLDPDEHLPRLDIAQRESGPMLQEMVPDEPDVAMAFAAR